MTDYLHHNRAHWNAATDAHWDSDFYDVEAWLAGKDSLSQPELNLLPQSLSGTRALHLQCHFGLDTLSLARRGAEVTGVDLSDRALARARELAARAEIDARFVESNVCALQDTLDAPASFDLVFSSYGTIGWLPDLAPWARVVEHFLAPGGAFVFAEFHPVVWSLDDAHTRFQYSYFNRGPIIEDNEQSYAGGPKSKTTTYGWNHSLGETLGALLACGLQLERFDEYDYSPHPCFDDAVAAGPGRYQLEGLEGLLPLVFALRMRKPE